MTEDEIMDSFGIPAEYHDEIRRVSSDISDFLGVPYEVAVSSIWAAMDVPLKLRTFGIVVRFRWWERPRWLWKGHAARRTSKETFDAS